MHKNVGLNSGLAWRFTDKRFTAWGGLRIFEELLRRLGWEEALKAAALPLPGSNRGLDPVLMVKGGAIVCRMGARIRRGEELAVTRTLANLGIPILRTINGTNPPA